MIPDTARMDVRLVSGDYYEIADRVPLHYSGRKPAASPATGSAAAHKKEQALLIKRAFA